MKEELCINNNHAAPKPKNSLKAFKLRARGKKREKSGEALECVSLAEGLAEARLAIDLFFDNQFDASLEVTQRQ